jgi:hypothetical protein
LELKNDSSSKSFDYVPLPLPIFTVICVTSVTDHNIEPFEQIFYLKNKCNASNGYIR